MHLPRALARFNRHVTNPIQRRWAGTLPGFGIVEHLGRRSGRVYRTPVNVFAADGGFAMVIGYGVDSDWVRNVCAAGAATLVHRRRRYAISAPRIMRGAEARELLPRPAGLVCRLLEGTVLHVSAVPAAA